MTRSPGSASWHGRRCTWWRSVKHTTANSTLLDHDRTHQIYRLVPNPAAKVASDFPRRLSETGLFASTRDHQPAPGVIPYSVNAPLWSDGATAERLLAVPGDGKIGLDQPGRLALSRRLGPGPHRLDRARAGQAGQPPADGNADPPPRSRGLAALLLSLERRADRRRPGRRRRGGQDDCGARCRRCGVSGIIAFTPGPSACCVIIPGSRKGRRSLACSRRRRLGVNTPQLNRPCDQAGTSANQLAAWHELGLLAWTPDVARLPKLVDPYDESARSRSPGAVVSASELCPLPPVQCGGHGQYRARLRRAAGADQDRSAIRPIQGTFNIAGARIIAPGDPASSVLYYRMSKLGGGRMPRVGSDVGRRAQPPG